MGEKLALIVDDAMFMRKMMRMTLTEMGFESVIEATDGDEAVELYKEHHPDFVLLDITMKNKHGLEALEEIIEIDPGARVIVCSVISQKETITYALSLGASDYVMKPFQKDELVKAVHNVLG